jgi:hypothetical protein
MAGDVPAVGAATEVAVTVAAGATVGVAVADMAAAEAGGIPAADTEIPDFSD